MADNRPRRRSLGWRVYLIGALVIALVVAIAGSWWIERPKRSAERFISLLSQGQIDKANAMLRDPSSLQTDAGGNVIIKASDASAARLTARELPLVAFGPVFPSKSGIGDYLAGNYNFGVSTSGPAVFGPENGQKHRPVYAFFVAQGGRIHLITIREILSRWGYVDFESQADQVPGIDYGTVFYAFLDNERGFIIWTDYPLPSAGPLMQGGNAYVGAFRPRHGRRLEFKFRPHYAKPGRVTIDAREFNLDDGRLFLVRDGREVKQLQRDLKELTGVLEEKAPPTTGSSHRSYRQDALADLARRDPEISSFYAAQIRERSTSKAP